MANRNTIEISAESIEEAIQQGLIELDVQRTEVAIDIVEEGSLGVLGIGKKEAVVRLSLLSEDAPEAVEAAVEEIAESVAEVVEPVKESVELEAAAETPVEVDLMPELEHEAEIALDVVRKFIELMGYDATIRAAIGEKDDMDQRVVTVSIEGEGTEALIGDGGEVLNKIQFLSRSMASQRLGDRTSFVVDVAGYRQQRQDELVKMATETADKAVNFKRPIALPPMPPHERRIIHMTLRNDARVNTESKGDGDRRRVRVQPEGMRPVSSGNDRRGGGGYRGNNNRGGGGRGRNDRRY